MATKLTQTGEEVQEILNDASTISITYTELVELRDDKALSPGSLYRITDYITTTFQENTQSAGHQFDVIVLALTNDTLSERAWAIHHEGDTYFQNFRLEAWQIWYCLDNDTSRFAWAVPISEGGKGVIYRMIDEQNNDCPYDFKNIMFRHPKDPTNYPDFYYTFTNLIDGVVRDKSLSKSYCYANIISARYFLGKLSLGSNIFIINSIYFSCYSNFLGVECHSNVFGANCYSNFLGAGCHSNVFGAECYYNVLGGNCSNNTFGAYSRHNKLGINCDNNILSAQCSNNSFGIFCHYNTFEDGCTYNTLGNGCHHNNFGTGCTSNILGSENDSNSFERDSNYNNIGNYNTHNSFGARSSANSIGNRCANNVFGDYNYYNIIGNYCNNNTLGNRCNSIVFASKNSDNKMGNYCQHLTFDSGVSVIVSNSETSSDNQQIQYYHFTYGVRGTIAVKRNMTYKTTVAKNSSGNVKQFCIADIIQ